MTQSIFLQSRWECRTQWSQHSKPVVLKWLISVITVYWGTLSSVSVIDTHFQVCAQEIRSIDYHPTLKNDVSHNLRRGYCVRIQPIRPRYIHGDWRRFTDYCRLFAETDERQRKCLVQRTIDTTAKNCNQIIQDVSGSRAG